VAVGAGEAVAVSAPGLGGTSKRTASPPHADRSSERTIEREASRTTLMDRL
jgi:hypothetical protein